MCVCVYYHPFEITASMVMIAQTKTQKQTNASACVDMTASIIIGKTSTTHFIHMGRHAAK